MMYKQIECPTCGNVTTAKSIQEPQKCQWCRRLFKVTITKRNTNGKKGKFSLLILRKTISQDRESEACLITGMRIFTVSN
jgi:hypothetical protein